MKEDDEDKLMKRIRVKLDHQGGEAKFKFLVKCFNLIMMHKTDPYLEMRHAAYLRKRRKNLKEVKEKTFYDRMQEDIKKREEEKTNLVKL